MFFIVLIKGKNVSIKQLKNKKKTKKFLQKLLKKCPYSKHCKSFSEVVRESIKVGMIMTEMKRKAVLDVIRGQSLYETVYQRTEETIFEKDVSAEHVILENPEDGEEEKDKESDEEKDTEKSEDGEKNETEEQVTEVSDTEVSEDEKTEVSEGEKTEVSEDEKTEVSEDEKDETGLKMPEIGFGTYRLLKDTYSSVLTALKTGYRHIDTASLYRNEEEVGRTVRDFCFETGVERSSIWITTKISRTDFSRIEEAFLESLEKLSLKYIDLLLLHAPSDNVVSDWKAMIRLKEKYPTQIRHIGVSNYDVTHLSKIFLGIEHYKPPFCNQIELSPYLTREELVNYCKRNKIRIVAHSPLVKGEKCKDDFLIEVSKMYKTTPCSFLLSWARNNDFTIIPRSKNPEHILENFQAKRMFISPHVLSKLEKETYATHPQHIIGLR